MRFSSSLALVASILTTASITSAADTCNGHSELCSKGYGEVTYIGAHNSYSVGVNNLFANQDYDVSQQLADGIRMLQLQAHNKDGTVELCHSTCSLADGGSLADYLKNVSDFMTANVNEVVTLLIVNIDNQPASTFASIFEGAGLDSISYSPTAATVAASEWPTLGEMIDQGKRLVTFIDNTADFDTVPYIIDEFSNVWETPYDVTTSFDCSIDRSKGDNSTQFYLINHFLDYEIAGTPTPDVSKANTTNAESGTNSLGEQVELCTSQYEKAPNFILVDFYEYGGGSVFQVAANINGVTYDNSTIATPKPTSTGSSSSGNDDDGALSILPSKNLISAVVVTLSGIAFGAALTL